MLGLWWGRQAMPWIELLGSPQTNGISVFFWCLQSILQDILQVQAKYVMLWWLEGKQNLKFKCLRSKDTFVRRAAMAERSGTAKWWWLQTPKGWPMNFPLARYNTCKAISCKRLDLKTSRNVSFSYGRLIKDVRFPQPVDDNTCSRWLEQFVLVLFLHLSN